jgi:RimJ/RimL family protein N-acetyltransferase
MIRGIKTRCRPMEAEDQAFVHELNSDPVVRSNVVGWDFPISQHHQIEWYRSVNSTTTYRWIVEDLDGDPVGLTGLWDLDWHNRNALTAIKLGGTNPRRGEGLGTDAILAVMAFAFYDVGLERLYSTVLATNSSSLQAYTKHSGWRVEGTSRRHVWRHGDFVDLIHIGALRTDFDSHPDAARYRALVTAGQSGK